MEMLIHLATSGNITLGDITSSDMLLLSNTVVCRWKWYKLNLLNFSCLLAPQIIIPLKWKINSCAMLLSYFLVQHAFNCREHASWHGQALHMLINYGNNGLLCVSFLYSSVEISFNPLLPSQYQSLGGETYFLLSSMVHFCKLYCM